MKASRVCAGVMVLSGVLALSAQSVRPPVQLSLTKEPANILSTPPSAGIVIVPTTGSFLMQTVGEDVYANRVFRVTLSGKKELALDVHALVEKKQIPTHDYVLTDYSPDPNGGLVVLLSWGENYNQVTHFSVLKLDEHGELRSQVELDAKFVPMRVAAFQSGAYFVAGQEKETWKSLRIEILDSAGKVISANLPLFADKAKSSSAPGGSNKDDSPASPSGSLLLASDENNLVYAFSYREPDVIEKISDTGKFEPFQVAELPVRAGESVVPLDMYALHGQVLFHRAVYSTSRPKNVPAKSWFLAAKHYWSVYDGATGKLIDTYGPGTGESAEMLVGYEPGNFYFLDRQRQPGGDSAYSVIHGKP